METTNTGKFGLNKFVERNYYKIKGKVYEPYKVHSWGSSIKIYKGVGKKATIYQFTCSDKGKFDGLEQGDRIEVLFKLVCKNSKRLDKDKMTQGVFITWLVCLEWKVWHGGAVKKQRKLLL